MGAWTIETPGGFIIIWAAQIAAGQLLVESTYQTVYAEGPAGLERIPVGSHCVQRMAWLNGVLIRDPDVARHLCLEAVRDDA